MDILKNFGFEWTLFVAQIVNFLIIFLVLKKFMYKPMLKVLQDRKYKIAEGIKQAEESARLLEEATIKEEKILRKAQDEAKKLIDDAKMQRDEMLAKSQEEIKKEVAKMLIEAREQINYESNVAQKNLEVQISKLAMQFLEKSMSNLFTNKEQETVMKNAMSKMKGKKN